MSKFEERLQLLQSVGNSLCTLEKSYPRKANSIVLSIVCLFVCLLLSFETGFLGVALETVLELDL